MMSPSKGGPMRVTVLGHIEQAGKGLGGYMRVHNKTDDAAYRQAQYHLRKAWSILKANGAK